MISLLFDTMTSLMPAQLSMSLELWMLLVTIVAALLFAAGVQLLLVFGVWVIGFHLMVPAFPYQNIAVTSYTEIETFAYIAIPFFVLVGDVFNRTDVSAEIVEFSRSIAGWLPGSTGNTAITTSGVFSAITGSNAATTASVGQALQPAMEKEGYKDSHAAATIAAGGTIGSVLPPSILLIIYGVTFGLSVPALFIAGIIPGLAMVAILIGINAIISRRYGYGQKASDYRFNPVNIVKTAWEAKIGLGTVILLLGGIFAGVFTPSEAAVVALAYIIVAAYLAGRLTDYREIVQGGYTSLILLGTLIPVIVFAVLIQQNLSYVGLQEVISEAVLALGSRWAIIIAMLVILMITGSALASVPNIVLTAPLLTPVALELGIDPITWGIIFILSDAMGFITPPYGLNLYIMSGLTDIDYMTLAYHALPYLAGLFVLLTTLLVFPEINILAG